jgi:hypothetical protein
VRPRAKAEQCRCAAVDCHHAGKLTPQSPYPAEKARGAEIILRRPWQRPVFVLGLVAPTIAAVLLLLFWR